MKTQMLKIFFILGLSITSSAEGLSQWQKAQNQGMSYLIYTPSPVAGKLASLMINLHGCTQHAQDLAELANWEATADKNNMIVVLPDVPNGGVVFGCWDYYGKDHTETNRDNGPLISLTENLIYTPNLKIDKSRVFISGLSSGSGQAAILGCMRPDLFSGVGLNSGPALGTGQGDTYSPNTTAENVASYCQSLAGVRSKYLSTQILSVIVSDQDLVVNPAHSQISVEAMQKVYNVNSSVDLDLSKLKGTNTAGTGVLFQDQKNRTRISYIKNHALGHAFPSGKGNGRTERYVNPFSIDYPAYLADLFSAKKNQALR